MSRELDEWRRRTAAAGLDVQKVESAARKKRGLAPLPASEYAAFTAAPSGDGTQPRARRGDQAARPDRASREGVASKTGQLWDRLRSIAESDLGDDEKRQLYETAGVDENRVRDVLARIEAGEAAEAVDAPAADDGIAAMLERRFGPPQNEAQRAYIESYRQQDIAEATARQEQVNADRVARLEEQQAEFEREEPWWMTTLKVLDKPRAVIVAGFSQLGAALDGDDTTVASWDRFADQVGDNVMVSSLIDEDMMPGWARFALGFGVDVLLDPLTYLTGGSAAVAKVTGKGGIKLAGIVQRAADKSADLARAADKAGDAATFAARTAEADDFARLVGRIGEKGGYGGLSKADRELAERAANLTGDLADGQTLRGGVYFRLPGTEGVRLPGLSEALTPVSRGVSRGTVNLKKTKFWSTVSHPFATQKRQFLRDFQVADSLQGRLNAVAGYRAATSSPLKRARFVESLQASRMALLADGSRLGVQPDDIGKFLDAPTATLTDGSVNPVAALVDAEGGSGPVTDLVQGWSQWWESARVTFNDLLGESEFIKRVDNYTFHLRLQAVDDAADEFAASARAAGGMGGRRPTAPEQFRKIQVGRTFRGVEIVEPDQARLLYGEALSPEQQAVEILRRQGMDVEAGILFSDDYVRSTELYVNMMGNRLERLTFGRVLEQANVGMSKDRFDLLQRTAAGEVVDRYRLTMRPRFGAQVASRREAQRQVAEAVGLAAPRALTADFSDLVNRLVQTAVDGGGTIDDVQRSLMAFDGVLSSQSSRVDELAANGSVLWGKFGRDVDAAFRAMDPEEMFDLYTTGISNRTAPTLQSLEGVVDELSVIAAGFDSRLLDEADAALRVHRASLSSEYRKFQAEFEQLAGRNLADEVELRVRVGRDADALLRQMLTLEEVASRVDRLRAMGRTIEEVVGGNRDGLLSVERALLPGSDGVARLGNGEVARFTRVNGDVGGGVADRVGVRFTLADDADAADARFLGDMVGGVEARGIPVEPFSNQAEVDALAAELKQLIDYRDRYWSQWSPGASGMETPDVNRMAEISRRLQQLVGNETGSQEIARAVTGQPFEAVMVRGSGKQGVRGTGVDSVLGPGLYATNDYGFALGFGDVTRVKVRLENPLVVDDRQWRALTKEAGWPYPQIASGSYTPEQQREWIANLRNIIESRGYDGVVAREVVDGAYRTMLGADQVVVFNRAANATSSQRLFEFTTSASRPLTFTGQTAGTQLNADLLMHGIRTNQINLRPVSVTPENVGNMGDILLWNRMVGIVGDASRSRTATPSMLVDLLNRTIRDYAGFDPQSFAARVVASTDNPADMLLDGVLNRAAMSSTDRAQLGVWNDLLDGVTVNGDKLGRSYANDLGRRGFDGAMLDDGTTRQIVSFRPDSMIPENPQSRALLRLLDQQTALRKQVAGLREKTDRAAARLGFDPELQHTRDASWQAARVQSRKRYRTLAATRNRTAVQEAEYRFRRDAQRLFSDGDRLAARADELEAAAQAEYMQGVRQAEAAGLPAAAAPAPNPRIAELREQATNVRLLAQADAGEADLVRSGVDAGYDMLFTGTLASDQQLAQQVADMLTQGMVGLNNMTMAPEAVARIAADAAKAMQTVETRKLLRAFDYLTGVFKSYAVMSPGFINRNIVGAVMNNWLGLVNVKSYSNFFRADSIFTKAVKAGKNTDEALAEIGKRMGAQHQRAFDVWLDVAPGTAGGMAAAWASDVGVAAADAVSRSGIGAAIRGQGLRNQGLRDNSLTRGFFYVNTKTEYKVRGVMAYDEVLRKSSTSASREELAQSAAERVFQYHFDYSPSGMSSFERNVLRRGIPFYVWTANNVPLQLKGLVTRPKVAASYWKFKQNMEELSEDEGIVPAYFGRLGAIRLPFTNSDGNHVYFMPDLPFRDLGMFGSIKPSINPFEFGGNLLNTDELLSSVNPIIRTPVETLIADKKMFTGAPFRDGYVPMGLLGRVPGLPQALGALGQAKRGPDGEWMVRERELYAVEQFQPLIGRISRLFPQDAKGREKQWTAWLSTFVGVGFRTNTWTEQSNQLFRLQDQLDTAIRSQESLGRSFPTKTEIQRANETERQVAMLGGYSAETDFLLRIINSGDTQALADLDGFGDESALKIAQSVAQSGAFTDATDLVTAKDVSVSGVERAVLSLRERSQFTLDPATASQVELEAMPNVGPKTAAKIVALRDRGGLVSLDSLRQVGLSRRQVQEIAEWLEGERQFQAQMAGVL